MPRRSRLSARANAHAAGFYVALLHDGEFRLARAFARWWLSQGGQDHALSYMRGELSVSKRRPRDLLQLSQAQVVDDDAPYSLDELGIDQEEFEWP